MLPNAEWPPSEFELPADWAILLFTDGAVEAHNRGNGHLGEDGLRRLLADQVAQMPGWRRDAGELLERLLGRITKLHGEELSDDVAMLLVGPR
jgi:serine phosphatase RsbU (regulator of sigma subunit)